MRTCGVPGCLRQHYAVGYCNAHWRRWKRNGDAGPVEIQSYGRGVCSFPGCGRPTSCKKLCASHYAQHRKHGRTVALNDRIPASSRDEQGRKRCSTCKQWTPPTNFLIARKSADGLKHCCVRCDRNRSLATRYGITLEVYERLSTGQEDVCAICGGVNDNGRALAVDHDRRCCGGDLSCGNCVRGLLCSNCNMGIGLLRDDPAIMRTAAVYVELVR